MLFFIKKIILLIPFVRHRYFWGYQNIPANVLFINFIFQRIFRINSSCSWSVCFSSRVISADKIRIGRGVAKSFAVSGCCYIQGINGIEIGDDTIFSFGVGIVSANHNPLDLNVNMYEKGIKIGKRCWLGKNVVILPGVELGDDCIVGAGSIVTKSFGAHTKLVGVPARPLS